MQMKGKVVFCKTIGVQQDYSRNEFKRMPDDLGPGRAAETLNKSGGFQPGNQEWASK